MARATGAAATLFSVPCTAFVSQGHLRVQPVDVLRSTESQPVVLASKKVTSQQASTAIGVLGLTAAGLAVTAAHVSSRRRHHRMECRVAGVCLPLTEKWDPLNLSSTEALIEKYTAAEVKHGRISMIACLGYVMPEVFRFPGCEGYENGLKALSSIPLEGWVQLVVFIAAHEVFLKPRAGGMGSYDFGFGTEVLEGIPADELEYRQTSERNNGRLAMVAIMGLMVQDGMFGSSPLALLNSGGWWGPSVDLFIKDIPICMGTAMCALKPTSRVGRTAMCAEPKMSYSMPFLKYPEVLDGWVGDKGFDPLGVTDALPVYLVREAELKHGRVCMLATVGWIATDLGVRFSSEVFQKVSTVEAHDKMVAAGLMGPFLATVGVIEIYSGWLCLEGFQGNIKREAGDFFLGKNFLPKEEAKEKEMRLKELENGRLAMFAFSGICTQAVLTGKAFPFL